MNDDLEHHILLGVELAKRETAQQLAMRVWKAKGKTIPEVNSAEWHDMVAYGRAMMDRAKQQDDQDKITMDLDS